MDKEQENQNITAYKKQLIQWRSLLKHLPETDDDRNEVSEIDQLISVLQVENQRFRNALDSISCGWNKPASVLAEEARLALRGE